MSVTKTDIRDLARSAGADYVGFARASDYQSPQSPELSSIFPGVRSLVVMAYRELSNCASPNMQVAMSGRLDLMDFSRSCNYRVARALEREGLSAMAIPASYPMEMSRETKGVIGEVSLRHAAVVAGLGHFGRNNLVVHPELGSRVVFTAVLTDLVVDSDEPAEEVCDECGDCVANCPVGALDEEGRTQVVACLKHSQPYGIAANIKFWAKYEAADAEERVGMLKDPHFWRLYQAGFIGFQYFCFNCMATCSAGEGA